MKQLTFSVIVWLCLFTTVNTKAQCLLPFPTGLNVTSTSCSATVRWNPVIGAHHYNVRYKKASDPISAYVVLNTGTATSVTINGLSPNTKYNFAVQTSCVLFLSSFSSTISKRTLACSTPLDPNVTVITETGATINWTPQCSSLKYNLQYKTEASATWTKVKNILDPYKTLTGLIPSTVYQYRIQAICESGAKAAFSSIDTFETNDIVEVIDTRPNIVFILLDDSRYDQYEPNGGPSWLEMPNIDRIANEGVNFKITGVPTPLCAPSRAMMYTGVLPHKNGCEANGDVYDTSLVHVQEILGDAGYYTGFVGKYGQGFPDPIGFDWWTTSTGDGYIDPPYTHNGVDTTIPGNILDTYPRLVNDYFSSIPDDKPFMLMYFHRAPHEESTPRPEDEIYSEDSIILPANFNKKYKDDYPSFFYTGSSYKWTKSDAETRDWKIQEAECLHGVDESVGEILNWLDSTDRLDNTIIIFSSDNGYLEGEHKLGKKGLGQDESFRVPLFIRYPSWFAGSSVVTDQIASLLDVPATMLDIAGIPNTFGFDGVSLHDLYTGDTTRKEMFYQLGYSVVLPAIRGVRSLDYLYVKTSCTSETEELYDLTIDPKEDTNRVNRASYSAILDSYRSKTDSFRVLYDDTLDLDLYSCNLINLLGDRYAGEHEVFTSNSLTISPNPASDNIMLSMDLKELQASVMIVSEAGQIMYQNELQGNGSITQTQLDISKWQSGIYITVLYNNDDYIMRKFTVAN